MWQVYAWNLRPEGPQPIWELEPRPPGGRGVCRAGGLQRGLATRRRWQHSSPAVDVFVGGDDGGGGKAVSRTLLGCEIPSLRADRPPDLRTGSLDLLLLCWHLVQPSCVHLEMVPMPGSAVISPSAVADARLAGRSGWVQAAVPSGDG